MRVAAIARLEQHAVVAKNAFSLYGSTIVTSAFGFGFWWLAAHRLLAVEVGQASAALSAVQLVATICVLGLNTLLISELARDRTSAQTLLTTAVVVVVATSSVAGIAVSIVLSLVSSTYTQMLGNPLAVIAFTAGVIVTAVTLVLDDACIGLLRGGLQLQRNTFFAIAKLLLVPVAAVLLPHGHGIGLVLAWTIATALSVWFLRPMLHVGAGPRIVDRQLIRRNTKLALNHHWLNIAIQAPRLIMPVIAVAVIGPALTAAFYAATLLVNFVNIIPSQLATVLFAVNAGDHEKLRREGRFTLLVSTGLAVASAPAFWLLSPFALRLFSANYLSARHAMILLGFTTLPSAVKSHYVVISRVQGRLTRAAITSTIGAAIEVAVAAAGGVIGGVTGMAAGLLIAQLIEALLFAPTVSHAILGRGNDSVPPSAVETSSDGTEPSNTASLASPSNVATLSREQSGAMS